jgi:tetratricopeptide (TPR) repeat protein
MILEKIIGTCKNFVGRALSKSVVSDEENEPTPNNYDAYIEKNWNQGYFFWNEKGIVQMKLKDYEVAIAFFDKALSQEGLGRSFDLGYGFATTYQHRGKCKFELNLKEEAKNDFKRAEDIFERVEDIRDRTIIYKARTKPPIWMFIQNANHVKQKIEYTIRDCTSVIDNTPITPRPIRTMVYNWLERGKALWKNEEFERAHKDFSSVINFNSDNKDALFYRGITSNELGDYESALIDFNRLTELEPDKQLYDKGVSLYVLGRYDEALKEFGSNKTAYDIVIKKLKKRGM